MNYYNQKGQILLIVVLVMVTALTVGLSVATRAITNIRISQEESNSEEAFSAAEAGLEQAMTNNTAAVGSFLNHATYNTTIQSVSGVSLALNNNAPLLKDDAIDLWLSTYPTYTNQWSGNLTFYWGTSTDVCNTSEAVNSAAALEIIVLTGTKANPQVTHYAFDPCSSRSLVNHFTFVNANSKMIAGRTYLNRSTISVNSGLFVRIMPLYAPVFVAVDTCDNDGNNCNALPSQGVIIESVGSSDTTSRKIVSYRTYPKLPTELFPYSLFIPQ